LIIVGKRREIRRYCGNCRKEREKYQCPVDGCPTSICKKCFDDMTVDGDKLNSRDNICVLHPSMFGSTNGLSEDSDGEVSNNDSGHSLLADLGEDGDDDSSSDSRYSPLVNEGNNDGDDCSSLDVDSDCTDDEVTSLIVDYYNCRPDSYGAHEKTDHSLGGSDEDEDGVLDDKQLPRRAIMENNFIEGMSSHEEDGENGVERVYGTGIDRMVKIISVLYILTRNIHHSTGSFLTYYPPPILKNLLLTYR
jgi:hypothetical protein